MSKVLPLIATGLFTLVCGMTAIWADPALGFLRYWAAAGTVIGVFLIRYIQNLTKFELQMVVYRFSPIMV